jgi:glycosyltransferase involved in cell wall biosynthesis
MLNALQQHYDVPLPCTRVIANGRDTSHYRSAPKEPFVFSAGRLWDDAKNIATLARIASRLSWPVYLAGEQRNPDGSSAAWEGCSFLGHLGPELLADWYARAPIYALPARYEPFGLSALEAALSGCALVLGDIPSLREVWGDAAVFVDPDDSDRLRAAIQDLIDHPAEREDLARRCQQRAQWFTAERMASEYLAAYNSAAVSRMACAS